MKAKDLYETLGVDKNATPDQIKKARRKKAAKHHPDKGGDTAEMAAVNRAHDVLIDPERRRLYDTTGEDSKRMPIEEEARQCVLIMFSRALEADAPNLLTKAKSLIKDEQARAKGQQKEGETRRAKLEARREKIKVKEGDNLFWMVIDQQLQGLNGNIAACAHIQEVFAAALGVLEKYTTEEREAETLSYAVFSDLMRAHKGGFYR